MTGSSVSAAASGAGSSLGLSALLAHRVPFRGGPRARSGVLSGGARLVARYGYEGFGVNPDQGSPSGDDWTKRSFSSFSNRISIGSWPPSVGHRPSLLRTKWYVISPSGGAHAPENVSTRSRRQFDSGG
jgi:hypothetical protein